MGVPYRLSCVGVVTVIAANAGAAEKCAPEPAPTPFERRVTPYSMTYYNLSTDADYSVLVDTKLPTTTQLARVNRLSNQMLYASYRVMAYPGGSPAGREATEDERTSYEKAVKLLDGIKQLDSGLASEMDGLRAKVDEIHKGAAEAVRLGSRDENDAAKAILADLDKQAVALSNDLSKANDERIADAKEYSNGLSASASSTSSCSVSRSSASGWGNAPRSTSG